MKKELVRTMQALAKLQTHRSEALYVDFLDLLNELREDIRLANDYESDVNQMFRNQGSIRTINDLINNMVKKVPINNKESRVYDGGYADI